MPPKLDPNSFKLPPIPPSQQTVGMNILEPVPLVAPADPNYRSPLQSDFGTAAMAGLRQSGIGTALGFLHEQQQASQDPDPDFNLGEALRAEGLEAYPDRFRGVLNKDAFTARVSRLRQQWQDQRDMAAAGPMGTLANIGTGLVGDPITFIPFIGGVGRVAKGVYAVDKGVEAAYFAGQMFAATELSGAAKRATMADPPNWSEIHAEAATSAMLMGAAKGAGLAVGGGMRGAALGGTILGAPPALASGDDTPGVATVKVGASFLLGAMIGGHASARLTEGERKVGEWATDKMFTPAEELKPEDFVPPKEAYRAQDFEAPSKHASETPVRAENVNPESGLGTESTPPPTTVLHTPKGKFTIHIEDDDLANVAAPPRDPFARAHSLSAAADPNKTLDDLSLAGGSAPRLIQSLTGWMTPNSRAFDHLVPKARENILKLFDNSLLSRSALSGESAAPGGSAEAWMKMLRDGSYEPALRDHDAAHQKLTEAGINMRVDDFDRAVGDAMRNHDKVMKTDLEIPAGADRFIEEAAASWRQKVVDPLAKRAVEMGLLSEDDLKLHTADSYFRTLPARDALQAQRDRFFVEHGGYWQSVLQDAFATAQAKTRERVAALDGRVRLMELSGEDRAAHLDFLKKQAEDLDTRNADSIKRLADIADAIDAGDKDLAAVLREQGGDTLKAYVKKRNELRAQRRAIGQGFEATAERLDRVEQRISEAEDRAYNDVFRVVNRGQKLFAEIEKSDPEAHAEKIDKLHTDLANTLARIEKTAEEAERLDRDTQMKLEEARRKHEDAKKRLSDLDGKTVIEGGTPEQSIEAHKLAKEEVQKALLLADMMGKHSARMSAVAKAQAERADRARRISLSLDGLEALDPEAKVEALKEALKSTVAATAKKVMSRADEVAALREKAAGLQPEKVKERVDAVKATRQKLIDKFDEKWSAASEHEGRWDDDEMPSFRGAAADIVQNVYDKWTGNNAGDGSFRMPSWAPKIERGPLKDRTYNVPEALKVPYTVRNARDVMYNYARSLAGAISFAERFDRRSPGEIELEIKHQYDDLAEALGEAKTDADIYRLLGVNPESETGLLNPTFRNPLDKRSLREWALAKLEANKRRALEDFRAGTELLFGTYLGKENSGNIARILRNLRTFNYLVEGGGFMTAHLGFLARPAMVHGLDREVEFVQRFAGRMADFAKGLPPEGDPALDALRREAHMSGVALNQALHNRVLTASEIGDPFARGTAIERAMQSVSSVVGKFNGLGILLDTVQTHDAIITQRRILEAAAGKHPDPAFLGSLDITPELLAKIGKEFDQHGEVLADGTHVPNTENWTDKEAIRAYRHAVWKQAMNTTPQRGFGDLPLSSLNPVGGVMLQFQQFLLAQHQRVLMRGLQQGGSEFYGGLAALVGIGIGIAYLKALASGRDRFEKFSEEMREDPRKLLYEGVDRSGVFPYLFWVNGAMKRAARGDLTSTITGPVGGTLNRIPSAATGAAKVAARGLAPGTAEMAGVEEPKRKEKTALIHMIPGGALPGIRQALQAMVGDAPWQ